MVIAKFIYETLNFERGMDPKQAIDLGMEGKLKNWFKREHGLDFDKTVLSTVLHYAVIDERLDLIKYLILQKKSLITDQIIRVAFTNKVDDEIIMFLIAKGDPLVINYIKSKKS